LVSRYDLYLKVCPFCDHTHLIRWGYYKRCALPVKDSIRIQRIRCQNCYRTTNVLPSFLLARRGYAVGILKDLVIAFINQPHDWSKSADIIIDISTAYRWLRTLTQQAQQALPAIRKALLTIKPEHPLIDLTDTLPQPLTVSRVVLKRLLALAEQLFKAAVCLVENNRPQHELFCFLNYFLTSQTGKALLVC